MKFEIITRRNDIQNMHKTKKTNIRRTASYGRIKKKGSLSIVGVKS